VEIGWIAGLLDCWIAGLRDYGITGLRDYGITGLRDYGIVIKITEDYSSIFHDSAAYLHTIKETIFRPIHTVIWPLTSSSTMSSPRPDKMTSP